MKKQIVLKNSFFLLVESRLQQLGQMGRTCTASNYRSALLHFRHFRSGADLPLSSLNSNMMKDFQSHLIAKGLKLNTVSLYLRCLRAVYCYAVDAELVSIDRRPFRKVFTGQEQTRKRAVRPETIRSLIAFHPKCFWQDLTRDLFLFSIYTQGMAFVDMANLTTHHLQGDFLIYRRKKTHRQLEVFLHSSARMIIEKYAGMRDSEGHLFPILYKHSTGQRINYPSALRQYNYRLANLSSLLNLSLHLTSYVSRHTWASLAKWNGTNNAVISEALGHKNTETTAIYLASLDTETIASANKVVIESLLDED